MVIRTTTVKMTTAPTWTRIRVEAESRQLRRRFALGCARPVKLALYSATEARDLYALRYRQLAPPSIRNYRRLTPRADRSGGYWRRFSESAGGRATSAAGRVSAAHHRSFAKPFVLLINSPSSRSVSSGLWCPAFAGRERSVPLPLPESHTRAILKFRRNEPRFVPAHRSQCPPSWVPSRAHIVVIGSGRTRKVLRADTEGREHGNYQIGKTLERATTAACRHKARRIRRRR